MMKFRDNGPLLLVILLLAFQGAQAQWVRSAKSRAFSRANAVASDQTGNVFTAGIFSCITVFDGDSLLNNACGEVIPPAPPLAQVDGFLSKRDENGDLLWVSHFPGSPGNILSLNDIDLDDAGNCYVTGAFTGDLDLAVSQFSNPDATTEFFLARILADGTVDWAVSYPLDALSESSAQKVSVAGNSVYITGYVRDDFQIGTLTDSVGNNASFVASFDLDGNFLWAKNFMEINSNGSSRGKAIEAKGDSIWVFSAFTDSVRIEGMTTWPPGSVGSATAGVICLYNAAGNLLDQVLTNTPFIEGMRLHRQDASLYITGRAENTTAIGGDTLFSSAGVRAYVSSHSLDLAALQWVVPLTSASTTALTGTDLDVSAQGNIYVAGTFNSASINGPATTATGGGGQNGFLVKIDASGTDLWAQSLGGTGEDALSAVSAYDDAFVFGAGYFDRYVRMAGDELFTSSSNGMVARIDICPQVLADRITADSVFACKRDTALFQVTANAAYTYQWYEDGSPLPSTNTASLKATRAGVYRAQITGAGCTKFSPAATLFLNPLPDSVVLTNDALKQCAGGMISLSGPIGSYTYQWMNNGAPMPEITKDISVQADGDYRVEVTDTLGCSILSDTFAIRFFAYPLNALTPPSGTYKLCSGNAFMLQAENSQAGMTWQWKRDDLPLTGEVQSSYQATESGIYQAVIKNSIGCETVTEPDTIIVQTSPFVDLNDETLPTQICQGKSLKVVTPAVIGQTYQWLMDGVDIPAATGNGLDISTAGEYRVRVKNSLCSALSAPFNLAVNPVPTAVIINGSAASICEGDAYQLEAQQGATYTYQWIYNEQPLGNATQAVLPIVNGGNYKLRIANEFNCADTSSVASIIINLAPPANISAQGPTTFCQGNEVELRANTGTALSWQWLKDGAAMSGKTQSSVITSGGGSFAVRVTNSNLCSRTSEPVLVDVVAIPVATVASSSGLSSICERDSLELLAGSSPSYDFAWLFNGVANGETAPTLYARQPGNYQVIASVGACRDTSAVMKLDVRTNPLPVITRNEEFLSIALFGSIQWYRDDVPLPGAIQQAIHAGSDGLYRVNVVNAAGCSAWSEAMPVCIPVPEIERTHDRLTVSVDGRKYDWLYQGLPINGASLRELTAQQSGNYSVIVTSADGCIMETSELTVCIPYPFITRDDFTGVLYAHPNPSSAYRWYLDGFPLPDGITQAQIPEVSGTYTVSVTDLEGCTSASEPFTVTPVTALESGDVASVKIFPNPAEHVISIESPSKERKLSVVISDAAGREVFHRESANTVEEIDISRFAAGIYTIVVRSDSRTTTWKLVKR